MRGAARGAELASASIEQDARRYSIDGKGLHGMIPGKSDHARQLGDKFSIARDYFSITRDYFSIARDYFSSISAWRHGLKLRVAISGYCKA